MTIIITYMQKLLAFFRKWFGTSKGFTLIELLVVIAILGVLLVGSLVAINPVQKINLAKDANAKAGVDQVASALQSYYTQNQTYPATVAAMVGATGELRAEPKDSTGTSFTYNKIAAGCTTACTDASLSFPLLAPATAGNLWCWRSAVGKASEVTAAVGCAP